MLKEALELPKEAIDGAGDEFVEVTKELGAVAVSVGEHEMIVVAHHDELVELDAVFAGAVGQAVLEDLADERVGP